MSLTAASRPDNIFDVLSDAADRYGDRPFLIVGRHEEVSSFRDLEQRAERFGRILVKLGVQPGDRVAIWMTNHVEWAAVAYGAARCGAVMVGVNTRLAPREVVHMLTLTQPRVWIVEDVFLGKVRAAEAVPTILAQFAARDIPAPSVVVFSPSRQRYPDTLDWNDLHRDAGALPALPPAAELVARSGDGPFPEVAGVAAILSTSGTTGAPKGVMLGHAGLIRLARACAAVEELGPDERFYSIGPMFHCSGYMHAMLTCLVSGTTYYTAQRLQIEEAWDIFTTERITRYHGPMVCLQEMAKLPQFDRAKLNHLDRALIGGPLVEMRRLENIYGTRMCELYGLTETGGNTTMCRVTDSIEMRHNSDGRPHEGLEVKIADPETGIEQPLGTTGEIRIRGWNVMAGYFRDPEATAKAVDAEGWLRTGDQGLAYEGGFIKYLSRLKDVIRVGGENLAPLEVEEVLMGHPSVNEAAVVAAPHARLGEVPVAFIVPAEPGHENAAELTAYCRAELANFKVPTRFIFMEDLPRAVAVHRVAKVQLREMLLRELKA